MLYTLGFLASFNPQYLYNQSCSFFSTQHIIASQCFDVRWRLLKSYENLTFVSRQSFPLYVSLSVYVNLPHYLCSMNRSTTSGYLLQQNLLFIYFLLHHFPHFYLNKRLCSINWVERNTSSFALVWVGHPSQHYAGILHASMSPRGGDHLADPMESCPRSGAWWSTGDIVKGIGNELSEGDSVRLKLH